jgi:hypothetical protein
MNPFWTARAAGSTRVLARGLRIRVVEGLAGRLAVLRIPVTGARDIRTPGGWFVLEARHDSLLCRCLWSGGRGGRSQDTVVASIEAP